MRTTRNTTPKDNITYLRYFEIFFKITSLYSKILCILHKPNNIFSDKSLLSALGPGCLSYEKSAPLTDLSVTVSEKTLHSSKRTILSMNVLELSEQEIGRRQSLQELRDMGIDPYPAAEYPTNAFSTDIKAEFKDEEPQREVCIAGRMMSRRVMGKASFAEIQDSKGRIQVYITRDDICPGEDKDMYNKVFKRLLDIGDFIGVKGFVFRTQTGEISVHAQSLTLLSKA